MLAAIALAASIAPPAGAVAFCISNPTYCDRHEQVSAQEAWRDVVVGVNADVNFVIKPGRLDTEEELRATSKWHVLPDGGAGTCVEYALTKEAKLLQMGFPAGAMELARAQVPDEPVAHMVLVVRLAGHVYVLDNLTPRVKPVEEVPYTWLAHQARWLDNPWTWVTGTP